MIPKWWTQQYYPFYWDSRYYLDTNDFKFTTTVISTLFNANFIIDRWIVVKHTTSKKKGKLLEWKLFLFRVIRSYCKIQLWILAENVIPDVQRVSNMVMTWLTWLKIWLKELNEFLVFHKCLPETVHFQQGIQKTSFWEYNFVYNLMLVAC